MNIPPATIRAIIYTVARKADTCHAKGVIEYAHGMLDTWQDAIDNTGTEEKEWAFLHPSPLADDFENRLAEILLMGAPSWYEYSEAAHGCALTSTLAILETLHGKREAAVQLQRPDASAAAINDQAAALQQAFGLIYNAAMMLIVLEA